MEKPLVIHCPRPNCEACIHTDCPRTEDEIKLCALLLKQGIDFSKMPNKEKPVKIDPTIIPPN